MGTIIIVVILFMNSGIFEIGGKDEESENKRAYAELEETLMKIEGVGEVAVYFHYDKSTDESMNPLTNYFSTSSPQMEKRASHAEGVLVVAEGAENQKIKNELVQILSTVLQLPEHRIIIVEMKKRGNLDENK